MEKQKTLAASAQLSGIALHTGARVTLKMTPAPVDTGIVFRRIDLPGKPEVRALASSVVKTDHGTTIAAGHAVAFTVEHIMAALHVHGIDNCVVEMNGMEPPIADGSALSYFNAIAEAGVVEQDAEARFFTPASVIWLDGGETKLVLAPSDKLEISCLTSFPGCPVDPQYFSLAVNPESFLRELAPARTFVRYNELKFLLDKGLVKGGSLDAAAIIHEGAIICKEKLHYKDEIVRHKIMDLVGDIYLCGRRVKANIIAIKPGHSRNVELAKLMLAEINQNAQK